MRLPRSEEDHTVVVLVKDLRGSSLRGRRKERVVFWKPKKVLRNKM